MEQEKVVVDEPFLAEEEIEPFDWEGLLYESWLEEQWRQNRKSAADASLQMGEAVEIGTRAIISIHGKPMLATHWDGYPTSLGRDLLVCDKSLNAVMEVAKAHTIDAADRQLLDELNRERMSTLAQKHKLSAEEIRTGKRRGNVVCADDFVIADIRTYRDLVEFEYDIRGNEVYIRPLDGWWPEALKQAAEFKVLTAKEVACKPTK